MKREMHVLYILLTAINVFAWLAALLLLSHSPVLLGTALLAFSLGLRHAVDADHIAAIDNSTRKLMQAGQRPVFIGLLFALGHSTIVLLGSWAIAATAAAIQQRFAALRSFGGLVGTLVSITFLVGVAAANIASLRANGPPGSWLARLTTRLVRCSWHMYPLGVLFGLGFDTATEIGVLNISAMSSVQGLPLATTLVFPLLFAAAMATVDSLDNIFMVKVYSWTGGNPLRRTRYSLVVTLVSVCAALGVGSLEALDLLRERLSLSGGFWAFVQAGNENPGWIGLALMLAFGALWGITALANRQHPPNHRSASGKQRYSPRAPGLQLEPFQPRSAPGQSWDMCAGHDVFDQDAGHERPVGYPRRQDTGTQKSYGIRL
jgi:nickel/cobalt transporter (NiCoT) family protein